MAALRRRLCCNIDFPLERWRVVVGVGWCGAEVAEVVCPAGCAGAVVLSAFGGDAVGAVLLSAFGGDAVGAVLLSGAPPSGHHCGSVTVVVGRRVGSRRL